MEEVGIDVDRIRHCVATTGDAKLESELVNKAWSPRALRVNGWRYKGMLEADLVTRAVCSGFVNKPEECTNLLKPRDPAEQSTGQKLNDSGISMGLLIASASSLIVFAFCALILYRRFVEKKIHKQIRDEVILEVTDKMMQYNNLPSEV